MLIESLKINLLINVQQGIHKHFGINKMRFLMYPSRLLSEDAEVIRKDNAGVIWLEK